MSIYRNPTAFLIVAVLVVLVGSIVTTFIPLFLPADMVPADPSITPYTALEVEGRDIYIREGCNNCHTQTVRPLPFETARYGPPSALAESAMDRPHLWGSKRTGPDLARVGGKYPDSWHYLHMKDPQAMFPESNMPAYAWLSENRLDTSHTARKMEVLNFPFTADEIRELEKKTEMDAMVAYLQKLGRDLKQASVRTTAPSAAVGKNPYAANMEAVAGEGKKIYDQSCAACHGVDLKGGVGPSLIDAEWKFGGSDADLFTSIAMGRPAGMPGWKESLGSDRIWKIVSYIRQRSGLPGGEKT